MPHYDNGIKAAENRTLQGVIRRFRYCGPFTSRAALLIVTRKDYFTHSLHTFMKLLF